MCSTAKTDRPATENQRSRVPPAATLSSPPGPAQTQLKRSLAGLDFCAQEAALSPGSAPVQMRGGDAGSDEIHHAAAAGIRGSGSNLPHADAIQHSFGRHDVRTVQAHVGGQARDASRAMGAEAFATGEHVAFAGAPDVHTAAHEAAHVVQQRAGVDLAGGVGESGDAYEREADEAAEAVVSGRSAEPILDRAAGAKTDDSVVQQRTVLNAVQMAGGLDPAQRNELQRITGDRISMAYTDFVSALQAHKEAIKAAAKAAAEMFALVVDVGMGFLIPGLAKGLGNVVNNIPVKAPEFFYSAAIRLQNPDFAKALVTGATKVGNKLIKDNAMALFGETEDDAFLDKLQGQFRIGFTATNEGLPSLSDDQVTAVCAAFDPSATNKGAYKAQIGDLLKKFSADVKSVGVMTERQGVLGHPEKEVWANKQAAYVWHEHRWKCALLYFNGTEDKLHGYGFENWLFEHWVSPEMEDMARAKTKEQFGEVRYLGPGEAEKIDLLPAQDEEAEDPMRSHPH